MISEAWPFTTDRWLALALTVNARQRFPCGPRDVACSFMEPHNHGVACDHYCHCKTGQNQ